MQRKKCFVGRKFHRINSKVIENIINSASLLANLPPSLFTCGGRVPGGREPECGLLKSSRRSAVRPRGLPLVGEARAANSAGETKFRFFFQFKKKQQKLKIK